MRSASSLRIAIAQALAVAAFAGTQAVVAAEDGTLSAQLGFETANPKWAMMQQSAFVDLLPQRPAGVLQEPVYQARPLYGRFRIGNAEQAPYLVVVDEEDGEHSVLYIDANRNGDLTDDPEVAWSDREAMQIGEERRTRFIATVGLDGTWVGQDPVRHHCALELSKIHGRPRLMIFNQSVWAGTVTVAGESRTIAVGAMVQDLAAPRDGENPAPLVMVDLDGDGTFKSVRPGGEGTNEIWRLDEVIELSGRRYEIRSFDDPTQLQLTPTVREANRGEPPPELLAVGTMAPDFTVEGWKGGPVQLSDLRGHAVIIDFWATWCSACKATMPYVEQLLQDTRAQGVVVLSICTGDTEDKYRDWVARRTNRYSFNFAYDAEGSVAAEYRAKLLPTKYIIDREGKIVAAFTGGGGPDPRMDRALEQIGISR